MEQQTYGSLAEQIDKIINIDIGHRPMVGTEGVITFLYRHARAIAGRPLVLAAAELISTSVKPGGIVILTTGGTGRVSTPNVGESDGPLGTAILARLIARGLGAIPFVLTEEPFIPMMSSICKIAGLIVADLETCRQDFVESKVPNSIAIEGFPFDHEAAKIEAKRMLDDLQPCLIVAVEKGGANHLGVYHNSKGIDSGRVKIKIHHLFDLAKVRHIPTLGVGDGATEIGMGILHDIIKQHIPYGSKCQCPCGGGIAPTTSTDVLLTTTVSNWGCYGIVSMLSAKMGRPDFLHSGEDEERLITEAARAGYADAMSGFIDLSVDAIPMATHGHIADLLKSMVLMWTSTRR